MADAPTLRVVTVLMAAYVKGVEHPSELGVRVVCALMLGPSYAPNRIGTASRGRCSNTFALSVKRPNGSNPKARGTLDEY
jgi:hypothetical protein